MDALLSQMRMQAQIAMSSRATTLIGIVNGYDPNTYTARVLLQPNNTLSGWLPILSPWVGNGFGLFVPPNIGDVVEVQFQEGSYAVGMICSRRFNNDARPLPVPSGEAWLVHESGSFIKLTNDGKISINGNTEIDITSSTVNITVSGNCTVQATEVSVDATLVKLGNTAGALQAVKLADNSDSINVQAT